MIQDIFQVLTLHPALISSYYVYEDMIEDIFRVLTSHPAPISSYYVYKGMMIEDIFQVLKAHPALISSLVQEQLLKIWHRMLIYHTAWICGP